MALMESTDVRLGTQGWTETDWQGPFYPVGLKAANRLASYSRCFDFVEVDSSFYATPAEATVVKWHAETPADFRFAGKVPQSITHDPDPKSGFPRRPLQGEGWEAQLGFFTDTMRLLGDKLLVLVAQLPPQWHWQPERLKVLERFLDSLPQDLHWAVEFRHRGWLNDDVMRLLGERQVAYVIQDLYYMPRNVEVTTPELAYIRLQGQRKEIERMNEVQIQRDEALDFWAGAIRELIERKVKRVIVAANNHYQGFSPATLAALQQRLGLPVAVPPARSEPRLPL
jgi:uncharacterized protein YecE (DUF72 family)